METTSVGASVLVEAPVDQAFKVFTEQMGQWWPPDHHILAGPLGEMVFEPRAGGHIGDRGADGSECLWARILHYEPPRRLVFTWDISPEWKLEDDPARASEVEVRFVAEGPDRTRVHLEHRHLERHGGGWESMRDAVSGTQGWPEILEHLVDFVAS